MATNRRKTGSGFGDEPQAGHKFSYLYDYNNQPRDHDAFRETGKRGFEKALLQELKRLKCEQAIAKPKVGIYLHGYNNDYQRSIDEIFDLERSLSPILGYAPIIVGFSWPSSGGVINYLSDREQVRDSVGAFTRFLLDIDALATSNERDCFSTTFCIAHSMGNYLLRKGLEYLSDQLGSPTGRKLFDETLMMAPDIAAHDIESNGKGRYIASFSRRVHVYFSKHDTVLTASSAKRFGANRLGRHGLENRGNLPGNVVAIDDKKYANDDAIDGL